MARAHKTIRSLYALLRKLWYSSPNAVIDHLFLAKRRPLDLELRMLINDQEAVRLARMSRYEPTTTQFLGKSLFVTDAHSYLAMCDEIFIKKNYEFESGRKDPVIIDCGANIGLSIIFFKTLYPACRVIAFEPDAAVFSVLRKNMESFGYQDIVLQNKAVWTEDAELDFHKEGSWSGRLVKPGDVDGIVKVPAVRLRDFLDRKIDFLKIDVEGAETDILRDCEDRLGLVDHLFVEYHSHSNERQTLQDLLSVLQRAGFRYHVKEAFTRDTPFIERTVPTPGMDLQLDIFAFRTDAGRTAS